MLCRVEMPANEEIFGRFYRYNLLKKKRGGGRSTLLLLVVVVLLGAVMLASQVNVLLCVIPTLFVGVYLLYGMYVRPGRIFSKKAGAALSTEVTILTENGFQRSVKGEDGGFPETESGQYSVLMSAVETASDFFLFTSPTQAYMLDKEYFTNGTPEELRTILQKKMGDKFKGKK